MKDILEDLGIIGWLGILAFAVTVVVLAWVFIFGPLFNQADYNNFQSSPQHMNAVAQKLSDDCTQLAETSDPVAKKAIEQDINSQAATVNLSALQMPDSTRTCVNVAINDVNKQK